MAAAASAVFAVAGAIGLAVATDGAGRIGEYISESGVVGAPRSGLYRFSILGAAAAVALLSAALRGASGRAAALLALAVPCVVASGQVRCSSGCPLPPYETPTAADLVHAGASIGGALLCAAAMLVLAGPGVGPPLRRPSLLGAVVAVPLQAGAGAAILLDGRGVVAGALERLALLAILGWLVAVAVAVIRVRSAAPAGYPPGRR